MGESHLAWNGVDAKVRPFWNTKKSALASSQFLWNKGLLYLFYYFGTIFLLSHLLFSLNINFLCILSVFALCSCKDLLMMWVPKRPKLISSSFDFAGDGRKGVESARRKGTESRLDVLFCWSNFCVWWKTYKRLCCLELLIRCGVLKKKVFC